MYDKGDFVTLMVNTLNGPKRRAGTVSHIRQDERIEVRMQHGGFEIRPERELELVKKK